MDGHCVLNSDFFFKKDLYNKVENIFKMILSTLLQQQC